MTNELISAMCRKARSTPELLSLIEETHHIIPKNDLIILPHDAEPEVGDSVEIVDHENITDMCGYIDNIKDYSGKVYYIKAYVGHQAQDCRNSIKIRGRKGVPVLIRKKEK